MLLHVANDNTHERETLSALLERAIRRHGLTQKSLAERSGVPLATLNAWIRGRRTPQNTADSKEQLRLIAEHLPSLDVAQLFESIGQQVPGEISPEAEARTMGLYRNLSSGRRRVVDQLVETLASEERTIS